MGSTLLLSGQCNLQKNGAFAGQTISNLSYDQDLGFFKVISGGNIWMTFKPAQVIGVKTWMTGALMKKYHVVVSVKFPNGDEFTLTFFVPSQAKADEVKAWVDNLIKLGLASEEVLRLLKTRNKAAISDISSIFSRFGLPGSHEYAQRSIESLIASGKIDGLIEGDSFISRLAMQRESVQYQVVTTFDIGKDGMVSLKCPSCGSPAKVTDKSSTRKCNYCGTEFAVPQKILDML